MTSKDARSSVLMLPANNFQAEAIVSALDPGGYEIVSCGSSREVLEKAEQIYFDLAFLPWPGMDDEDLLERLVDLFPDIPVLAVSEQSALDLAVSAMRKGAFDFLAEPLEAKVVREAANLAMASRRAYKENGERRLNLIRKYDVQNIVGRSAPMQDVFRLIHKVAATDANVLILGESGTGKELVARAIHYESTRRDNPLVPVNCGAIPEELLESELFGHEKGAFTGAIRTRPGRFELAEGGTVLLDEIGDMSPMLQVKLLRVLQEHQFERVGGGRTMNVDIRVIAATHQHLEERVTQGDFREDLYYRLNVVPISVPPLRDRRSDIIPLCDHFLHRLAAQKGLGSKTLHPEVKDRFLRYNWPGNVRELENLLERMVILADGDELIPEDLPPRIAGDLPAPPAMEQAAEDIPLALVPEEGLDFNATVDAFERKLILQALERTNWVKNRAASLLKLNRTTLVEKIKKKGLTPEDAD